jgi:hypothetical protein
MNRISYNTAPPQQVRSLSTSPRLRATIRRWHTPTVFALVALCFVLPFATVSCDKARTSFTGIQLVTRTVPHGGQVDEGSDCSADLSTCVEQHASFPAEIALLAALLGCALGLLAVQKGPGWCAGVASVAMLDLVWQTVGTFANVTYHPGLDGALALSAWAAVVHLVRARRRRRAARAQLE